MYESGSDTEGLWAMVRSHCITATIEHRFGSWQRAVDLACGSKNRLDDADILDSLRAYQVKTGHRPTSRTYDAWEHRIAAHRAIEQRFASWQRALELAFKSATTD
jgi:Homing endonuclease associated repeat